MPVAMVKTAWQDIPFPDPGAGRARHSPVIDEHWTTAALTPSHPRGVEVGTDFADV